MTETLANQTTLSTLRENIINLKEQEALNDVEELLKADVPPWDIMNCFNESLTQVGTMFQSGTYFMTGLILAGEIMRQTMELLLPHLSEIRKPRKSGLILVGTIEGDIHDLGKNMAVWMLEADGFEVVDLGVDVPSRVFLREVLQREPDAVGISMLFTSCAEHVKRLARLIKEAYDDRPAPPIFVGCGFLNPSSENKADLRDQYMLERKWLGVDYLVEDAFDTLRLCRELVTKKFEQTKSS
ncbi:MAG: cobalamin-dependent protein [Deltaproteobacteria bacterium]|jgi:5-methyltetrahydrofolate--homocysteine methyltransferase|nr:cobalamin-dependent protein [Deltaproteobacteria bacterium]